MFLPEALRLTVQSKLKLKDDEVEILVITSE